MNAPALHLQADLPDPWGSLYGLGYSLVPIPHGEKATRIKWAPFQTERASSDTITRWASSPSNIGIVTGAISGLIVLDLDSAEAIAAAEARGLPDTPTVRTGKGLHVYFAHPGGTIGNRAGIFPGADIRGDGGYVVAPGSIHPNGSVYEWENPPSLFDLAPVPGWLLAMLRKPTLVEREAEKVRKAPAGTRNDQLNKSAFRLGQEAANGNADPTEVRLALASAARDAGLEPDETGQTLASGMGAGRASPKRGDPSEDDIALAFTAQHRNTLRFDNDAGAWFEWDGARWRQNNNHRAFSYAREIARQHGAAGKANFAGGVERFARADRAHSVNADVWDTDPWLLGTPGGTVDLRTGELFPARPADYITKLAGCAPEHGTPELWLRFLHESAAGDADTIRFLQQWFGYALTGDTREHALAFAHGPGGNGKSVWLNTMTAVLGEYAATSSMETFTASRNDRHSTELAMLRGARLVTASETEEGRQWAEAKIKQMTGGDPVTARFMRQDNFTFRPEFKLTIAGNHAPRLANVDEAMKRRFNIVPFTNKPANPDRQLEDKLKAEHGRILAWAIAGCRDWQANGLVRPAAVTTATAEYFETEDLLGQWLGEQCDVGADLWEIPAKLYADWKAYATEAGEAPGTNTDFGKKLTGKGFPSKASCGVRKRMGLALRAFGGAA